MSILPTAEEALSLENLGVCPPLISATKNLKYFNGSSPIQQQCLPPALAGRDLFALAPIRSRKSAAYVIPILESLFKSPQDLFACILVPTKELAYHVSAQFQMLGASIGVRSAVIIGGMDYATQAIELATRPHIIVAEPRQLADHLRSTAGFSLSGVKFLVRLSGFLKSVKTQLIFYRLLMRQTAF
jgi:ATP-dependent RNA helicase DDX47/RRP3